MALFKIWDEAQSRWIIVNNSGFSTIKIGEVYIDADGPQDMLNILEGDHISLLPNENFDSVVVSVKDIGDLTKLPTVNKSDIVNAIVELNSIINNHSYTHIQSVPSNSWNIKHNLNRTPSVTVLDSNKKVIIADIEYIDDNNLTVTFSKEYSGRAVLN